MPLFPNWSWLPARFGSNSQVPSLEARPCLPSVEKLDGRVLLSVSMSDISVVKVLDKATPLLAQAEAAALSPIDGESADSKHKGWLNDLGVNFLKVNSIFMNYEDDIVGHKLTADEPAKVSEQINLVFAKIEFIAESLDQGDGLLLPAVQKVHDVAFGDGSVRPDGSPNLGLLGDLSKILPDDIAAIPDDERAIFVKMNDEFWKLDEFAIDMKLDVIRGVPSDVAIKMFDFKFQQEDLKIKLDESQLTFSDDKLKLEFSDLTDATAMAINGIVHPPVVIPDLTFTGGLTVQSNTADTIV